MEYQKCPVCEGRGLLPHGFYIPNEQFTSSNTTPEICKTCGGKGIIVSPVEITGSPISPIYTPAE